MRRIDVIVSLSALHKQPLSVPEWEVPLLVQTHGGQVDVIGESHCDLRVPDPVDEYMRLERRYGRNKETLNPRVQEVYGIGEVGVAALAKAMARDLAEQAEIDAKAEAKVSRRKSSE